MEKEINGAAEAGYVFRGVMGGESAFGGKEVSVILERDPASEHKKVEHKLLATSRTSTMEKELQGAGAEGFQCVGVVVGKTALGGSEVVSILRRYPE